MNLKAITTRIKNHLSNYHQKKKKERKQWQVRGKCRKYSKWAEKKSMKKIPEIGASASILMLIVNVLHSVIKSCSD